MCVAVISSLPHAESAEVKTNGRSGVEREDTAKAAFLQRGRNWIAHSTNKSVWGLVSHVAIKQNEQVATYPAYYFMICHDNTKPSYLYFAFRSA